MARRRILYMIFLAVLGLTACSPSAKLPPLLVQGDGLRAVDQDGTQVELLASDAAEVVSQPTWAPDSSFAVWTEFNPAENVARIAMGNGESQRRIDGNTFPFFYGFSPDGQTLAYLGNDPAGNGVALGLLDVGSGVARLVATGQPFFFDWAADSSQVLVHANQADTYLLNLEGEMQPLDVAPGAFQAPAFLDDGRLLLVENGSLVALEQDSDDREVLAGVGSFSEFAVAGDRIAFTANPQMAPGPLAVTSLVTGGQQEITDLPVIAFEWSPNNNLLYYLALEPEGLLPGIWNGEESIEFEPALPSTVFLQSYLPFWDQYSRFHTLWRADSSGFYLPRENGEIVFYPTNGGEVIVVAQGAMAFPAPG